jgi:cell division protein ZapE
LVPQLISQTYAERVRRGQLATDPAQAALADRLDLLATALGEQRLAQKSSALGWLFGARREPPRGLYVWGDVGRGKTMLMDLFFESVDVPAKQRVHFQAFMADVHHRLHAWRQAHKAGQVRGEDPIAPIAETLFQRAPLLCFDEFAVTDITDAMLIGRLFAALFERGVVVVATSNVAPDDLYKDGLNRALFLPFINLLKVKLDIIHLAARTDFRLEKLRAMSAYLVPADAVADASLARSFHALSGEAQGRAITLSVLGRPLRIAQAAAGVARMSFGELCRAPLGPADYLAIAREFHTLIIDSIPIISADERDVARRFILLVDALYDQRVKLIASAEGEPSELYRGGDGQEAQAFARTASRLVEMRAEDYLAKAHGRADSSAARDTSGIVET